MGKLGPCIAAWRRAVHPPDTPTPTGYLCTRNKLLLCLNQYILGSFVTVLLLALPSIIFALLKMEKKTLELQKGKVTEKLMFLQFFLWNWCF